MGRGSGEVSKAGARRHGQQAQLAPERTACCSTGAPLSPGRGACWSAGVPLAAGDCTPSSGPPTSDLERLLGPWLSDVSPADSVGCGSAESRSDKLTFSCARFPFFLGLGWPSGKQ